MSAALERLTTALADRYTIERQLGAGGMATVCLTQDLKHDRKVAIKVLRPELDGYAGWSVDGRLVTSAKAFVSTLWRFVPERVGGGGP